MTVRRTRTVMALFLSVALLAGCAAAPELAETAAGQFQARVATAKQLAGAQDYPGALAELDQLGREVQSAAERGDVSPQRRARIESSISKVRADLEAAGAAVEPDPVPTTPAPEPAPEPAPATGDGEEKDKEEEDGDKGGGKGKGKDD